jgi:hypothetical protein
MKHENTGNQPTTYSNLRKGEMRKQKKKHSMEIYEEDAMKKVMYG